MKRNSSIKVIYERVGQATRLFLNFILDYEHIFFSKVPSRRNKFHPTTAGALAYLYNDIGMGTKAPLKGQCKPQETLPGLVYNISRGLENHIYCGPIIEELSNVNIPSFLLNLIQPLDQLMFRTDSKVT